MTTPRRRLLLALALGLGTFGRAEAACTDRKCTDPAAVETVRARIATTCDCQAARSRGAYLKCVREVVATALGDGSLPDKCKAAVMRCESQTVCGRRNAVVCCSAGGKARIVGSADACKGTACTWLRGVADGCTQDGTCTPVAAPFRTIQQVFAGSCALQSCHSAIARQGGLALDTEDVSYTSLVGRDPTDASAQGLGLLRVAAGDSSKSLLLRKLRGEGPGTAMPQNAPPLAEPLVSMIDAWVARGAKTTAEECAAGGGVDPELCGGRAIVGGNFKWKPQKALKAPGKHRGIRLYVPKRPVDAGQEWETCYAFRPDWKKIAKTMKYPEGGLPVIKQQEYRMHEGSHHLLMYMYYGTSPETFPKGFYPCFASQCLNAGDCPKDADLFTLPIGGTQVAGTRYVVSYPDGVGIPVLNENAVLIANLHYTNPFQPAQDIYGEAWLNFEFHKPKEFKVLLDGIFAINAADLLVEPFETKTISRIWRPRGIVSRGAVDAAVFQLFGHMHKRGELFQIDFVKGGACSVSGNLCGRDSDCECKPSQPTCVPGQVCNRRPDAEDTTIYHTTRWDHAPVNEYPRPNFLMVNKDQGLRWTCTHTNGYANDPTRPPKRCHESCNSCGWNPATRTCTFDRGVEIGVDQTPRVYNEGDPMPVVFGELADDDMCNMFGYFIPQAQIPNLPKAKE